METFDLFTQRAPWFVAGPLIGLLVVGLLWVTNRPLGSLGGYIDLLSWLRERSSGVKTTVWFLAGTVLGGLLSALAAGGLHPTLAYGTFDARYGTDLATRSLILVAAGAVMGYGARQASGCTSGHGVCGTALGSPRSWVATATFMATAIAATNGLALLMGIPR
jgi:uncharacterized protein